MHFSLYLALPLCSALMYSFSVIIVKKVMRDGVNSWRVNFISNWLTAVANLPFLFMITDGFGHWPLHHAVMVAATIFIGQLFTFLAINKGDVSVATPLLGIKVILVAFLTVVLLSQSVPLSWWIAAILSVVALGLFRERSSSAHRRFAITALYAIISAASFACTDILVQKWVPVDSYGKLMPLTFFLAGLFSCSSIPFFKGSIATMGAPTGKLLLLGCSGLAIQGIGMGLAIGFFGNATAVNVVYSSRGMWSVVLVWALGRRFGNEEHDLGNKLMLLRLIGSLLLLVAIVLVIMQNK
jgi:drug/metabolite transporter (DMT)-like permease